MSQPEREDVVQAREQSMLRIKAQVDEWLHERGFLRPGQTRSSLMRELAEFRQRLPQTPRPDPKDWARLLLSRVADGKPVPLIGITLAHEALETRSRRREVEAETADILEAAHAE